MVSVSPSTRGEGEAFWRFFLSLWVSWFGLLLEQVSTEFSGSGCNGPRRADRTGPAAWTSLSSLSAAPPSSRLSSTQRARTRFTAWVWAGAGSGVGVWVAARGLRGGPGADRVGPVQRRDDGPGICWPRSIADGARAWRSCWRQHLPASQAGIPQRPDWLPGFAPDFVLWRLLCGIP